MKIEKLAENKFQVVLTTADLSDMDMDLHSLEGDSKDLNGFLFMLMERIREETGFNPYGGRILMEAFPTEDNGISITVSKIHNEAERKISRRQFGHLKQIRPRIEKECAGTEPFYVQRFEDVCMLLCEMDESVISRGALYEADGEYCFLLPPDFSESKGSSLLYEFSHRRSYHSLQGAHVREHGRLIAEGERLLGMARGIKQL